MPRFIHLDSLAALRAEADAWDSLWQRSEVSSPTARAELVALHAEQFAPDAEFHALAVEDRGRWVAALPLVGARLKGVLNVGKSPANSWCPGGTLLLDPQCDVDRALDLLVSQMPQTPWRMLYFDNVPLDSPAWQALRAACARRGMASSLAERHEVARLDIGGDWDAYHLRRSKNFRDQLARSERRLAKLGEVRFEMLSSFDPAALEDLLHSGFEVEHRNWKGQEGTSVLGAGMFPFFAQQAQQIAQWGQLQLAFLTCSGKPVAFAYCWAAKGVCHLWKIGYDEECGNCRPGYLLVEKIFHRLWDDPAFHAADWMAEHADYQLRWRPAMYRIGRMLVAVRGVLSPAIAYAHEHLWPWIQRSRRRLDKTQAASGPADGGGVSEQEMAAAGRP